MCSPFGRWTGLLVAVTVLLVSTQVVQGQLAFDWGRPCTLVGTASASEISPTCGKCGDGAMATNATKMTCNFKDVAIPAGSSINFAYHGKQHHLFVAPIPCTYTTEICPSKDGTMVTASSPCSYKFLSAGIFYVNDKSKHYCKDYSANLKVTVT